MMIAGHQVDDAMFSYIAHNIDADTCKLLLKDESSLSFNKSFAILQIECRNKTRHKISELLQHERFLFPKAVSAEQCTHEVVAKFHASHFNATDRVLDMTMGLGVDDYYIAKRVLSLTAIELDPEIASVGQYNFSFLAPNVEVCQGDSIEFLHNTDESYDAIFIDPARRGDSGKRLYGLADCRPDVLSLLPLIKSHTSQLFIKASPMIDVTQAMRDLDPYLTDVWAVSIKNECKELFFKLDFKEIAKCVNLHALNHDGNEWKKFSTSAHIATEPTNSSVVPAQGQYLYEPNSSIMKLGCYNAAELEFGVAQIAANSHLMVSDALIVDFPGRQFRILEVVPFKDKEIKQLGKRYKQMNVATRNFRLNAKALKKRLRVNDGGDIYLFGTTLSIGEQVLILCEKVI